MRGFFRNLVVLFIVMFCLCSYTHAAKKAVATHKDKTRVHLTKVITPGKSKSSKKKSSALKNKVKEQLALLQALQSQEKKAQAAVSSARSGLRKARRELARHRKELMRRWKQKASKRKKNKTTAGKKSKILFPTEFGPLGEKAAAAKRALVKAKQQLKSIRTQQKSIRKKIRRYRQLLRKR